MKTRWIRMLSTGYLLLAATHASAVVNLGTVGDSLTDEYLSANDMAATDLAAWNWVQILAATRPGQINFGLYRPSPADNWGGSRDTGYEFNWAKSGAVAANQTTMKVIGFPSLPVTAFGSDYASTQTNGLVTQVNSNQVDTVFVGVGANDFYFRTNWLDGAGNATPIPLQQLNLPAAVTEVTNGILYAVDSALNTGNPRVLVATVHVRDEAFTDARSVAITAAAEQVNSNLQQAVATRAANGKAIAMVDLWAWSTDPLDPHQRNPDGSFSVGGLLVTNTAASREPAAGDLAPAGSPGSSSTLCNASGYCATANHVMHFIADDGLHPNTVVQAMMANQVIKALDTHFGENIPVLSDEEIEALVPAIDSDLDGDPNKTDPDDDNDGVADSNDNCPVAVGAGADQTDTDSDGAGNPCDLDDDNDGVADTLDAFPLDATETVDTDGDGTGDNADADSDNDGVVDESDNCPLSPGLGDDQTDTDSDGTGNLCDSDDDNDKVIDSNDAFPLDATESVDTDGDGTGNNSDTDDDNDGLADESDNCPLSPGLGTDQLDSDADGAGNLCDTDDDNDNIADSSDAFPLLAGVSVDGDADGLADSWNTGCDALCQSAAGIALDNCVGTANPDQANHDGDTQGDACDSDDDNDRVPDDSENALGTDPLNNGSGPELLTVVSFENGVPASWTKPLSGNAGWVSDTTTASHLGKSLRSGNITHNQKAQIQTGLPFYGGSFSVDIRTSTESSKDNLRIYVDNLGQLTRSGSNEWQTVTIPVTGGTHTIRFEYLKNGTLSAGEDAVWIDRFSYINGTDTDGDGQIDAVDTDDDNDGLPDTMDPLPLSATFNLGGAYAGSSIRESTQTDN